MVIDFWVFRQCSLACLFKRNNQMFIFLLKTLILTYSCRRTRHSSCSLLPIPACRGQDKSFLLKSRLVKQKFGLAKLLVQMITNTVILSLRVKNKKIFSIHIQKIIQRELVS